MNISKGVFIIIALVWGILSSILMFLDSGDENIKIWRIFNIIFLWLTWISLTFFVYNVSYEEAYEKAKAAAEELTE